MSNRWFLSIFSACILTTAVLSASADPSAPPLTSPKCDKECKTETPKEETVTTNHSVTIGGENISYQATVGTQTLSNEECVAKASIFYTAYIKEGVVDKRNRPITFCFNGGPGSASIWLHLGVLGPKRIDIDHEGKAAKEPYHLSDNPFSLLDVTDLVFIDPVSTGFSRAVQGEDAKQFHGVEKDIESVAEFIRLYITRNERWESPKFLAGESYGTTRAAGLALELHDTHHIYMDGILLISCVLNFQTIKFTTGNDLPYMLFLPTYTATALYHNKLDSELQKDPEKTLKEVENFAFGEYSHALMMGDRLAGAEKASILEKLSKFTGLSSDYIESSNYRLSIFRFAKELLKSERRVIGRFDSRLKGIDSDVCSEVFEFDPSYENIVGVFTATFNNYIRTELNWKSDDRYKIIADVQPWDYGHAKNQFLDVSDHLRQVMSKNTSLEVFVASGYYDLATPYVATEYTLTHLGLDPSLRGNVTVVNYEGGHMMYLYYPTLVKMKADLSQFMNQRLEKAANQ